MKNSKTLSLAVVISLLFASGCYRSDQPDVMTFRVDANQLDAVFTDSRAGFRLGIPKGLSSISVSALGSVSENDLVGDSVLVLYLDSATEFSMLVKAISAVPNFQDEEKRWNSVTESSFKSNGITIKQVVLENADVVNFKLFFELNGQRREIDYLAQRLVFADCVTRIESSIGSLSPVKNFSHNKPN